MKSLYLFFLMAGLAAGQTAYAQITVGCGYFGPYPQTASDPCGTSWPTTGHGMETLGQDLAPWIEKHCRVAPMTWYDWPQSPRFSIVCDVTSPVTLETPENGTVTSLPQSLSLPDPFPDGDYICHIRAYTVSNCRAIPGPVPLENAEISPSQRIVAEGAINHAVCGVGQEGDCKKLTEDREDIPAIQVEVEETSRDLVCIDYYDNPTVRRKDGSFTTYSSNIPAAVETLPICTDKTRPNLAAKTKAYSCPKSGHWILQEATDGYHNCHRVSAAER
jgi:hypothetical protein